MSLSNNKNTTLKWITTTMKEKIIVEDKIIDSEIRGIYGIFVETEKEKKCGNRRGYPSIRTYGLLLIDGVDGLRVSGRR